MLATLYNSVKNKPLVSNVQNMEAVSEMPNQSGFDLKRLRKLVKGYTDRHQLDSALFWADKIVSLSGGEAQDVYWYANTLYLTGQYLRASHLLQSHKLDKRFLVGQHLRAQCLFSSKDYQEALNVLDQVDDAPLPAKDASRNLLEKPHPDMPSDNVESAISLLRGRIYEAMDNRALALDCFKEALRQDVHCYEAFDCLVQHQMMTADEERQLLNSLPFDKQCNADECSLVKFLYENMLKKYNRPPEVNPPIKFPQLAGNYDVVVGIAERYYYNCDFQEAYRLTSEILKLDPYNHLCLPLHITVLVELKKLNELFYLAHKLVDLYPGLAVAWFAVGCYYYLANKHEPARRFLSKSTTLNRVFGPAWLVYGHSFAAENEHDQAMAAYLTASQLMKGCHLPLLYIGLEYGLTNNSKLADRFFSQALQIAPEDPFVLHEIGVIAFQSHDFEEAERNFLLALDKIESSNHDVIAEKWEPLLNNLGHVSRKLKKYDQSLQYHRQSLVLCPHNPATYSAMGFTYSLKGNYMEAVNCFHKALGLRKDDSFSTTMLQNTIENLMLEAKPCDDLPDPLPPFTYNKELDASKTSIDSQSESLSEFDSSQVFTLAPVVIPADIQDVEMEDV